ncbi:L-serine ammonia-lyase, iron-sulfur-dependent, subunit alpha, partial [Lactiplantibacillus plantarum]|uniref:L-serine ammonia-lyase, iron-sulfur-dependent, subunit alpha n=1 Tax=Lactiplantibacillus plantarum TaxID=1590 RepID=UPI003852B9B5
LAGVLLAMRDRLHLTHDQQLDFLFTAGAFGLVIANNAGIAGAEGGCQEEVGSASAMAAAALVYPNIVALVGKPSIDFFGIPVVA